MSRMLNRSLSLFLCLSLLMFAMPAPALGDTEAPERSATLVPSDDPELARAFDCGLAPDFWGDQLDTPMAINDFCALLMRLIEPCDASLLSAWEELAQPALTSTRAMKREDAMMAVYEVACLMQKAVCNGDWWATDALLEKGDHFWELSWDYPDWPNAQETSPYCEWGDTYIGGAYHFAQGQVSLVSGKRVFDLDEENLDLHMLDPLTKGEALVILLRFGESLMVDNKPLFGSEQTAVERAELDALIARRRAEILQSKSEYAAEGRVYYVSPTGDDARDGLTPQTAWRTLDKVNSPAYAWDGQLNNPSFPEYLWVSEHMDEKADLRRGDCVLFERGGLWRGVLRTVAGVTYSAYGEGEKPRIYGSPENGAGAEKWIKAEGTENAWRFYRPLQDCGAIRCDEDTVCLRDYVAWDGEEYRYVLSNTEYTAEEIAVRPVMTPRTITADLHFYCDITYPDGFDNGAFGTLYLRCDEGNPGEVFSSIEFLTGNNSWSQGMAGVTDDVILDNLCFRYGAQGINAHDSHNAVIRGCEISWVGGMVMTSTGVPDEFLAGISGAPELINIMCTGDAIMLGGVGNRAENNYISNTFDYGVTVEGFSGDPGEAEIAARRRDCAVSDNLLERCNGGLLLVDWAALANALDAPTFVNIRFDRNLVADTGMNAWAHHDQRYDEQGNSQQTGVAALAMFVNHGCEDIQARDNVLAYTSKQNLLVSIARNDGDSDCLTLAGNTYLQALGYDLLAINEYNGTYTCTPCTDNALELLAPFDASPRLWPVSFAQTEESPPAPEAALSSAAFDEDELDRAFSGGFAPDSLGDQLEQPMPLNDFCTLLTRVVERYDASALAAWEDAAQTALGAARQMKREDAMMAIYEAACVLGQAVCNGDWASTDALLEKGDHFWELSWDYPDWPNAQETSPYCDWGDSYIGGADHFAQGEVSRVSGNRVFDLDEENRDLHMLEPLTKGEAVVILLRFYESLPSRDESSATTLNSNDPEPSFVALSDAAACTLSGDMLAVTADMPPLTEQRSRWRGTSLALDTVPLRTDHRLYRQEDCQEIADMGFNYIRLQIDSLQLLNGDGWIDQTILENVDNVIYWCAQLGIHVNLDMHSVPGYGVGLSDEQKDILTNPGHAALAEELWRALAKRYRSVSRNALSFNLVNEPTIFYFTEQEYAVIANQWIAAIRESDPDKLILSDGMLSARDRGLPCAWDGACPSMPVSLLDSTVGQTIHLYPYFSHLESNYLTLEGWPYEHMPVVAGMIHDDYQLCVTGDFKAGSIVEFYFPFINGVNAGQSLAFSYNRHTRQIPLDGFAVGENHCTDITTNEYGTVCANFDVSESNGYVLRFDIAEDTNALTLGRSAGRDLYAYAYAIFVRIPADQESTYMIPDNGNRAGFSYETGRYETRYFAYRESAEDQPNALHLENKIPTSDHDAEGDSFDMETLRAYLQYWRQWADERDTFIMCNEFGVPIGFPQALRESYYRTLFALFDEYRIPWALYTNQYENWGPVVSADIGDWDTLPADGSLTLRGDTYVDETLLTIVREYTR